LRIIAVGITCCSHPTAFLPQDLFSEISRVLATARKLSRRQPPTCLLCSSLASFHNPRSYIPINQNKMKFTAASILLFLSAINVSFVSARSRKLSKGSKSKITSNSRKTNPASTQDMAIISQIYNRNDGEVDRYPIPVFHCDECTDEGESGENSRVPQKSSIFSLFSCSLNPFLYLIINTTQPHPGCPFILRSARLGH
jgi:hypothetical protein